MQEKEKLDFIAAEHGKKIHWKESLKLEQEQLTHVEKEIAIIEKKNFAEAEKMDYNVKKATRNLEVTKEKAHLRGVVDNLANNVSAGETSLNPVVRTLAEFLGKLKQFL